ncbi:immunity 22 family protein [Thermoactinomyces sp. CICC 10521]|uniref:immunity 22 family protein n=1 Tax=Thermoactinomyces sp. CICC 10521 TaxID=2767426 RepID=UPI0018DE0CDD|nr:immunity 22 family protein [Thermoactinomyces sp. CICC 10521]MBH8606983.1 immunity 22 family protein [Thermoactinomyces sp. CICC 10521]
MEKEGYVSLFIGNLSSFEELENYVMQSYTEDGNLVNSEFGKDFNIEYYDDDFREVEFHNEPSRDLRVILKSFSYDEKIIPEFIGICGEHLDQEANSVILLYNFDYDGNVKGSKQS